MTAKITNAQRDPTLLKVIGLAGGIGPLAKKLGLDRSSVAGWRTVPLKHVIKIESALSGQITRAEMAPEFFS